MPWTPSRLVELGRGYNLDGAGYAFEPADQDDYPALAEMDALVYEGDWEYFPLVFSGKEMEELDCPFVAWLPYDFGDVEWPKSMPSPWSEHQYVIVHTGWLNTTERTCTWCEGAGEECTRCEGMGVVESAGGTVAVYALKDPEPLEVIAEAARD